MLNFFAWRWTCAVLCWSYTVGICCWSFAVFCFLAERRWGFVFELAWLTFWFNVGLAQFFVGIALSEFPVGLSHFLFKRVGPKQLCVALLAPSNFCLAFAVFHLSGGRKIDKTFLSSPGG